MTSLEGRVMLNHKLKSLIYHHIYYVRANCRSDPVILTYGRKSYKCGICGETGHTRKRCILGNSNDPVSKKLLYYLEGVGVPCPETEDDDDDEEDLETQVEDYDPETEVDSGQIGSQEEMELLDAGELSARQFYAQLDNDPLSLDWNGYETDGQEEVFDSSSDEEETAMNVE